LLSNDNHLPILGRLWAADVHICPVLMVDPHQYNFLTSTPV
jgi:hypothetical protein